MQAECMRAEGVVAADDVDRETRFAAFVSEYRDRAVGLAWRLLDGDSAAAEDVAQEAFVRAYQALGRFREEAKLSTWFYRILVNEAKRHRRWRWVRQRFAGDWREDFAAPESLETADVLQRERVMRALEKLPRGQREALVLVHFEGFTVREASAITGRAEGTIKVHIHRAVKALRIQLAEQDTPQERDPS